MKTLAILFMILLILLMVGFGFMYILGFAMSFDAPGSDKDAGAWMMRLLMFAPGLILLVALVVAFIAFSSGQYKRSVIVSSIPLGMAAIFIVYMFITSFMVMSEYQSARLIEAADAKQYPVQKFLRPYVGGADTIIVFPSRIVAYRLNSYPNYPSNGPLGDLNNDRTSLIYNNSTHTKLTLEELDEFVDENGRRFTDVYTPDPLKGRPD